MYTRALEVPTIHIFGIARGSCQGGAWKIIFLWLLVLDVRRLMILDISLGKSEFFLDEEVLWVCCVVCCGVALLVIVVLDVRGARGCLMILDISLAK